MARSKQPPMRRESSSEFFNKRTASWEESKEQDRRQLVDKVANGTSSVSIKARDDGPTAKEAGVVQLLTAVAGIYASL